MASFTMNGNGNGGGQGGVEYGGQDAPEYTLSGVLHFLQSEWRRYEHDRNSWVIERAEHRARIALLEGERRGVENVKNDLMRRIKMLEYALRQERFKNMANAPASSVPAQMRHDRGQGSGLSTPQGEEADVPPQVGAQPTDLARPIAPSTSSTGMKLPLGVKDGKGRAKSRAYLQQCLQEIAYLTNPATLNPLADLKEASAIPETDDGGLARPRFVLSEAKPGSRDEKEAPAEAVTKEADAETPAVETPVPGVPEPATAQEAPTAALAGETPVPAASGDTASASGTAAAQPLTSVPNVQLWKLKSTVQAHFDSVRALQFGADVQLFTASDDCTIRQWDIKPGTGSDEVSPELLRTLRAHQAAVTCLAYSKERQTLYSGSVDATVRAWDVQPSDETVIPSKLVAELPDAVWDMALFPFQGQEDALLATASADGAISLWWTEEKDPRLYLRWDYYGADPSEHSADERASAGTLPIPTSITAIPANLRACAVGFTHGGVKTFSMETGKELKQLGSGADHATGAEANMVVAHPTLPLVVAAQEDSHITLYDVQTGACTMSLSAHSDSVACVDIDPSGLTLVSGSHDCTVRFWDLVNPAAYEGGKSDDASFATKQDAPSPTCSAVCFQEIRLHEKKANEGVLAVVYHSTAPLIATAGADGTLNLFG